MKYHSHPLRKLVYSAVCLALALVLPFLTGQLQQLGNALCPMHIPVLLCGFLCGWPWGLAVGATAPLLRFFMFGMPPPFPIGVPMAFELAVYGAVCGFLHPRLPQKLSSPYITLLTAMLSGRVVWGLARFLLAGLQATEFPFSAFVAGAFTTAIPGIAIQLILIPLLVTALTRAGLSCNAPTLRCG